MITTVLWWDTGTEKWDTMPSTKSVTGAKGVCRYCGCTEHKPCWYLPHPEKPPGGQPVLTCKWADKSQTLCTNPACLANAKEVQG
jgi:hypothetical protein